MDRTDQEALVKPETKFRKNKVIPFLKTLGNTVSFPVQQIAISGDPDYVLCCHGVFVALELKAVGGFVSPLQEWKLDEVSRTGGVAIVAHPGNWEKVKLKLYRLDQGEFHDD